MKKSSLIVLCIFLVVNSITGLYGQNSGKKIKITGFVVDGSATPVAGAVIMIDGKATDNITDSKGFYKIKVTPENKKIGVFNSTQGIIEEEINGRENINLTFKGSIPYEKTGLIEEPVDVGYEKVKKNDVLVPVGTIDGKKSKYAGYNTIYDLIRGKIPGVQVVGTKILIRSTSSVNLDSEPLLVVDGAPVTTIENIHPQDVKSVEILKGSAASIYGSRGSNGVILINLLKGYDR
jgi:TonB-dependent SusC/RagA subfamily outer membrane receptor